MEKTRPYLTLLSVNTPSVASAFVVNHLFRLTSANKVSCFVSGAVPVCPAVRHVWTGQGQSSCWNNKALEGVMGAGDCFYGPARTAEASAREGLVFDFPSAA